MTETQCPECGAQYSAITDSCAARFDQLLALDHSRREPWGSRHGQAFAAFALQHPRRFPDSTNSAWASLYRIYCLGQSPARVFANVRAGRADTAGAAEVRPKPLAPAALPTITIADLGDFSAEDYPARLDAWCLATLRSWGAPVSSG